jgi:RNA polymerase subunit RPABC4/transcription elongation factor Spt4
MMHYVLLMIDGRSHIITESQKQSIVQMMNSGQVKTVEIGDDLIVLSSISGIPTLDTYKRQMKQKLAEKSLRMCRRCSTILGKKDECPCRDQPEKFPDILAVARRENPALAKELDALAEKKSIPQLTHG